MTDVYGSVFKIPLFKPWQNVMVVEMPDVWGPKKLPCMEGACVGAGGQAGQVVSSGSVKS